MEIRRKDGKLSVYGLACGYVEQYYNGDKYATSELTVEMYMEHSHYHVRSFNSVLRDEGADSNWNAPGGWRTWVTFDSTELLLARKEYATMVRKMKVLNNNLTEGKSSG